MKPDWKNQIKAIRHLMIDLDVRQKQLCNRFKVSPAYISQILNYTRPNCYLIGYIHDYLTEIKRWRENGQSLFRASD